MSRTLDVAFLDRAHIAVTQYALDHQIIDAANITALDFWEKPTDEPVVFAWMPAASVFFHHPDGNLVEFLSMLPDAPQSDLGVVGWSRWKSAQVHEAPT